MTRSVPSDAISVMIVDDLLYAQSLSEHVDREPDLHVIGTASGAPEATEMLASLRPDLVITRLHLNSGSAFEILKFVKDSQPETKVLVVARITELSFLLVALESGCSGFLTTSQSPEDVVRAIRAARAGDVPLDPAVLKLLIGRIEPLQSFEPSLTQREFSVLALLSEGLALTDIAASLDLSVNTVRNHVQHILVKLHSHSMLEAVVVARRAGLLSE